MTPIPLHVLHVCESVGARLSGKESNQNIMSFANNIVDSMIIFGQHVYERVHKEGKLKY